MFIMEMIEGKDRLWELGNPEIDDSGGNHANLLLHLCKSSVHSAY